MKSVVISLCLLFFPIIALAHDEPVASEPDDWKRNFRFGFNLTDGNSETSLLNTGLTIDREKENNIWHFEVTHSFGEEDNDTNVDTTTAVAEYKRTFGKRYYFGFGNDYRRDEIADVKYRVTLNPILGLFLSKSETFTFKVEAGPSYIFEEVADVEDDYLAPRVAERIEYTLSETAKIFEEVAVKFDVSDGDNYIIEAEAGIEAALMKKLSLILSAQDIYDNVPGEGLKRNDLRVLTSLAYAF